MPTLTIGLPVYNGAKTLARALDNMLAQTHSDFVAIVSDNASTDDTAEIAAITPAGDARIRYFRQVENIVWNENFRSVLMRAKTSYFMWMTHDDLWDPRYAEENIRSLEMNSEAVCSVSKIVYFDGNGKDRLSLDTNALTGQLGQRLRDYFLQMDSCGRLYGVYRTKVLQESFPAGLRLFGTDWLVVALTLRYGTHVEIEQVLLKREEQPSGHYFRNFGKTDRFKPGLFEIFWPLCRMHRELHKYLSPEIWRSVQVSLRYLDLRMLALAIDHTLPGTRRVLTPIRENAATLLHRRWRQR